MLFCLAWAFNFLIGGLSGVVLSDVPTDTGLHGSFFVMAHFHYTIMGGLIFSFFAGDLLLGAEDARPALQRDARQVALLADVHRLQLDLPAAVRARHGGHAQARQHVRTEPAGRSTCWVSISAFVLGFSMLIFLFNVVYSLIFVREPAEANPWHSKSLEWQVPTPVPVNNFEQIPVFDSDPYDYGTPLAARRRPRRRPREPERWRLPAKSSRSA